jgi:hypothetical protein
MSDKTYSHHFETGVDVDAAPDVVFAELDDHEKLSAHMMKASPMMGGGSMRFEFDEAHGRAVGSEIRLMGQMMGVTLDVREVVTEREPPRRKVWETIGVPHLLVIGDYRMGFQIEPRDSGSRLTVFIDYEDPPGAWAPLGWLLGPVYARWCTVSMATGAAETLAKR